MNYLEGMELQNTYFAIRHGRSSANEKGIIVSNIRRGKDAYGLTPEGSKQVRKQIKDAVRDGIIHSDEPVVIFASPFLRARQTAEIIRAELEVPEYHTISAFRERDFGFFEGQSVAHYQTVWDLDRESIDHHHYGVESIAQVQDRMTGFVRDVEDGTFSQYQCGAKTIVLVSHGDPLQILQTAFDGISPSLHRSVTPLETAAIRKLERT